MDSLFCLWRLLDTKHTLIIRNYLLSLKIFNYFRGLWFTYG
jgi:hypothetical protein